MHKPLLKPIRITIIHENRLFLIQVICLSHSYCLDGWEMVEIKVSFMSQIYNYSIENILFVVFRASGDLVLAEGTLIGWNLFRFDVKISDTVESKI